ncbi:MAG: Phosphoenolpyruvate carboxykinase, partial [Pseudonocardia sp.]|nr:Phosphoenolpyruvate carboxykinase [Pseudonocardia sp.]
YFKHWIELGKRADASKLPKIFYVNWFRRGEDRRFLWPGFGENSRVLKWAIERIEGTAAAEPTAIGRVPAPEHLDLTGLDVSVDDVAASLVVDDDEWRAEVPRIEEWFDQIGDRLPSLLRDELDGLKLRLGMA